MNRARRAGTAGRRAARFACASAAAAIVLCASPGRARAGAPGAVTPDERSAAEALADHAFELYTKARYAESIAAYLRAYALSNAAATLFNVATIYDRKLHEGVLAAEYYRRYLLAPDAEPALVQRATARLAALDREAASPTVAAPAPAPAPTPAPTPTPTPTPTLAPAPAPAHRNAWRIGAAAAGAAGLAVVGTSLALGLVAKDKNDSADALCDGAACSSEQGVSLAREAGAFAAASTVTFVAGLACLGAGVAMLFAGPGPQGASPPSPAASPAVSPQIGPKGASLNVKLEF